MTGMTKQDWQRQRGTVIRLAIDARHDEHGTWTIPCEIDADAAGGEGVIVP
jgi:hypothetical protein